MGAKFDSAFLKRIASLKVPVSPHLEGGEGETFVSDAPFFSKAIKIREMEKEWDGARGVAKILKTS